MAISLPIIWGHIHKIIIWNSTIKQIIYDLKRKCYLWCNQGKGVFQQLSVFVFFFFHQWCMDNYSFFGLKKIVWMKFAHRVLFVLSQKDTSIYLTELSCASSMSKKTGTYCNMKRSYQFLPETQLGWLMKLME